MNLFGVQKVQSIDIRAMESDSDGLSDDSDSKEEEEGPIENENILKQPTKNLEFKKASTKKRKSSKKQKK